MHTVKDVMEYGDTIIVFIPPSFYNAVCLTRNQSTQLRFGHFKHSQVAGRKFGSKISCSNGFVHALRCTPELWSLTLPHRTQILYAPDTAVICHHLDLRPGSVVLEAGTGSGALSHTILRCILPMGKLWTFEINEERHRAASSEFSRHGYGSDAVECLRGNITDPKTLVSQFEGDVDFDVVFLDIPEPWRAIEHSAKLLRAGGRLCTFSPCGEQVQQVVQYLAGPSCSHSFSVTTTLESFHRSLRTRRLTVLSTGDPSDPPAVNNHGIPTETMVEALPTPGHTGYLTFATKLA